MTIEPGVLYGIMTATWSLKEAAYYVHNLDPTLSDVEIQPTSTSLPSVTYYWLQKELNKRLLQPVSDDGDKDPRFSPGTIMRHLENNKKHFDKSVLNAYNNHGVSPGPTASNTKAKFKYQKAAKLIHDQYSSLPKTQVAELLTQLPAHMGDNSLSLVAQKTIQSYLVPCWTGKEGRPPNNKKIKPNIDWSALVKKLIG